MAALSRATRSHASWTHSPFLASGGQDATKTTAAETLSPGFVAFSHGVTQGGPPPTVMSSLFLASLSLALATVATTRADSRCLACGEHALDLQSRRELLLPLAKRSILDKLHLSQRPTLSRPVSRAALRIALQRLHGRSQGALPEADRGQEYEIISFAETGGLLTCRSSSKPDLSRKGVLPNLNPDFLPPQPTPNHPNSFFP